MIEILNGTRETVVYRDFRGIKLYHNIEKDSYPEHWHSAIEIIVPSENSYTVVLDDMSYTFSEGDVFIVPPGIMHELVAPTSGGERLIVLLDYNMYSNIEGMDVLLQMLHPYMLITKDEYLELNKRLRFYLDEISREYANAGEYAEATIYSLFLRFFVAIGKTKFDKTRRVSGSQTGKQPEYIDKIRMVCNYISEHCTENMNVEDLSDMAGFSKFHFARLFKQYTGLSCYEYLMRTRVEHAEKLLVQPEITITEVAMLSGFNSLSTFNRVFKTHKNCTPTEYKTLNRK